ncbi:hypothetical protein, partial [Edaphobacter aggregans]|uniref:hypothetical protein n=1 Tax=Edaphobacter aggregans TaxID=570835 RepID=UPI001B8099D6
ERESICNFCAQRSRKLCAALSSSSVDRTKNGNFGKFDPPKPRWPSELAQCKPDFGGSPSASSRSLAGDAIWRLIQPWPISLLNIVPSELSTEEPGAADQSANRYS